MDFRGFFPAMDQNVLASLLPPVENAHINTNIVMVLDEYKSHLIRRGGGGQQILEFLPATYFNLTIYQKIKM